MPVLSPLKSRCACFDVEHRKEWMRLVVHDFLHFTESSVFMNGVNISLLFTCHHASCFFMILFNFSPSWFRRLPPQQAIPKVSVLLTIEV